MKPETLVACIGCSDARAQKWAPHVTAAMDCYGIDTPQRQAMFLATIGHESGLFSVLEENLNYSAEGLVRIFGKYFTPETAKDYARKPEKIANKTYGNRMGNGDEASGDGWRYRGRGLIQLTGKESYFHCGKAIGLDLVENPDLLLTERPAAMSAGWEWESKGCSAAADSDNFEKVTKLINGGLNGYAQRIELWQKAKAALEV